MNYIKCLNSKKIVQIGDAVRLSHINLLQVEI